MAQTTEQSGWRRIGKHWDLLVITIIGPILTWGADVWQGLAAGTPARGLCGSPAVITGGLLTSAGVYFTSFLVVWAILELFRWLLYGLAGVRVTLPRIATGALTLFFILWLDF